MLQVVAAGSALAVSTDSLAQAKVDEKDPQAVALGYVDDTKRADTKKFPKHSPDQKCAGCQLFTGKAGAATGPCTIFAGKLVAANGWCSAWTKKAG
jgi:hypothetical protein